MEHERAQPRDCTPPSVDATRWSRRSVIRASVLVGGSAVALGFWPPARSQAQGSLPEAIASIMAKARYATARWSLLVLDLDSGETLYALRPDDMAFTGSVRKLFSVGLALRELGVNHRFETPVYRLGEVNSQGVLHGDLALVGAADLTFGGRLNPDGSIAFTTFDHNDANNLGTAVLTPQDPLVGLDSLARQVHASGIRAVTGDVIIDDRLFESFRVPNGNLLVTPILVNENMVDVTVTPTTPGEPATIDWRPRTRAFSVTGAVTTVAAGETDSVSLSGNGRVECIGTTDCAGDLEGDIPVDYRAPLSGSRSLLQTFRIEDPAAFARTAFLEALARAGVSTTAPLVSPNPGAMLPDASVYRPETRVAVFTSPPYSEDTKLILKVSLNLGANLSLMYIGLARGARTVDAALAAERDALVSDIGIDTDSFDFPTNGSGSPDSRATPRAVVQMLASMDRDAVASAYRGALPVLGVDGSLATTGTDLPARGHVMAKTGTTLADGQLVAQNLAGYIDARDGRRLAFALFVNDAGPIENIADITAVFDDQAAIVNVIYESGVPASGGPSR